VASIKEKAIREGAGDLRPGSLAEWRWVEKGVPPALPVDVAFES
jgi:hypothetical protein